MNINFILLFQGAPCLHLREWIQTYCKGLDALTKHWKETWKRNPRTRLLEEKSSWLVGPQSLRFIQKTGGSFSLASFPLVQSRLKSQVWGEGIRDTEFVESWWAESFPWTGQRVTSPRAIQEAQPSLSLLLPNIYLLRTEYSKAGA